MKQPRRFLVWISFVIFGWVGLVPGAQASFIANRPLNTDDIGTPGAGQLEIPVGADWILSYSGDRSVTPIGILAYGLRDNWDVEIGVPVVFVTASSSGGPASGLGDIVVGSQYRFAEEVKGMPGWAAVVQAKLPTADSSKGLGTGMTDLGVELIMTKTVGAIPMSANLAYTLAGRGPGVTNRDMVGYSLSGAIPVGDRFYFVAEVVGNSSMDRSVGGTLDVHGGVVWQVAESLKIDVGYGTGVATPTLANRWTVGLAYLR